jgi:hypothetical protein
VREKHLHQKQTQYNTRKMKDTINTQKKNSNIE